MSSEYSNTAFNEHTGALIKSRNSKAYEDNYERIFSKKETPEQEDSANSVAEEDCK